MNRPVSGSARNPSAAGSEPNPSENSWAAGFVDETAAPERIGAYKILEPLGQGGMGVVYLAEQLEPVQRRVALKLLKLGMDTHEIVTRFESERQTLALLSHPNVAAVYDAGATEQGRPYFVMEYVPGAPITHYCDERRLTVRERLELFLQVCAAVQHAHQKGVIHRDLKPGNILVVEEGFEDSRTQGFKGEETATSSPSNPRILKSLNPHSKIIDFGIAKATHADWSERPQLTEQGQFIGTPEYMSPEQAGGDGRDVDTRTDVYALGVVLYELLVGALPFAPSTLRRAGYMEMQRILREVEPPRPSTRLVRLRDASAGAFLAEPQAPARGIDPDNPAILENHAPLAESPLASAQSSIAEIADYRRVDPAALRKQLRGDLDWIVMKALAKDRAQRYASASELAADIARHLNDEPVLAGPPSAIYRLRKFFRKHRGAVAAAAALLLTLTAGLVTTLLLYARAVTAETRAKHRFEDVRKLAHAFLFDVHEKIAPLAGATPAREFLVKTALEYLDKLAAEANDDPDLQRDLARAYEQVGDVQGNSEVGGHLGDTAGALRSYRKSLAIRQTLLKSGAGSLSDSRALSRGLDRLGEMLRLLGKTEEALAAHRESLQTTEMLLKLEPQNAQVRRDLAVSHAKMGGILAATGQTEAALDHYEKLLAIAVALSTADSNNMQARRDLCMGHSKIGDILVTRGALPNARKHYQQSLEIAQALSAADPQDARARRDLSVLYDRLGDVCADSGDWDGAVDYYRQGQEIAAALAAADPANAQAQRDLLVSHSKIGDTLAVRGQWDEALALFRQAREIAERLAQMDATARARRDLSVVNERLGDILTALKQFQPALEHYQQSLATAEALSAADPADLHARRDIFVGHDKLGGVLLAAGRPEEAQAHFRQALELAEILLKTDPNGGETRRDLAVAWRKLGQTEAALGAVENTAAAQRREHWRAALDWFQKSLKLVLDMQARGILAAGDVIGIEALKAEIAQCEQELLIQP